MKTLLNICFLVVLFNKISLSQFYADSVISNYVFEFMEIADENTKSMDSVGNVQKEFTDEEIYHVAKLYYKAFDEDPVGFNKYISFAKTKWDTIVFRNKGKVHEPKPAMKRHLLVKKIAEKYGIAFTEVLGTPAFLRCKYITWNYSDYYSVSMKIHSRSHNFILLIEDVLKGNKYFSVGDTISISFHGGIENPNPDFTRDSSYLIPVRTLLGLSEGSFNIAFNYLHSVYDVWEMGKPPKTFPIENDVIKDVEYFGIQDTSWNDFKKYFKETYLIFE